MQKLLDKPRSEIEEEIKVQRATPRRYNPYSKMCGFQDKKCDSTCSLWDTQNACCVFTVIAKRLDLK